MWFLQVNSGVVIFHGMDFRIGDGSQNSVFAISFVNYETLFAWIPQVTMSPYKASIRKEKESSFLSL